jgi:hypothetical protein
MFSTCVARGIAGKLVYETVGGKVETSLYCSTAAATPTAAAIGFQKKRRKMRQRPGCREELSHGHSQTMSVQHLHQQQQHQLQHPYSITLKG